MITERLWKGFALSNGVSHRVGSLQFKALKTLKRYKYIFIPVLSYDKFIGFS